MALLILTLAMGMPEMVRRREAERHFTALSLELLIIRASFYEPGVTHPQRICHRIVRPLVARDATHPSLSSL